MTARRFLSLFTRDGDDDMFSSDLSEAELIERVGGVAEAIPVRIVVSGADEYVPDRVDKYATAKRIAAAMGPKATVTLITGANHSIADAAHISEFVENAVDFIRENISE